MSKQPQPVQSAILTAGQPATRLWNLPNILTLSRLVMIPVFVLLAYWPPAIGVNGHDGGLLRHAVLTGLFALAALTDWLDGYLARKLNQTSAFGRFLDPVADKLMVAASLIILVQWHPSVWMALAAIVIVSREITVSALREWMAELGHRATVAVSYVGKVKTTFQMIAIGTFLFNHEPTLPLAWALLLISVFLTLWSMMIYLKAAWPSLREQ